MTAQRLSSLSCNKEEFEKSAQEYQEVLKNSGFSENLNIHHQFVETAGVDILAISAPPGGGKK